MKYAFLLLIILTLGFAACGSTNNIPANDGSPQVLATMEDFKLLEGDNWDGSLSYLNYNSDERSTIPVKLAIKVLSQQKLQYAIQYPGETQHNAKEVLSLSKNGNKIDGAIIVSRDLKPNGTLILITEANGRDDNKPADIQMVYTVSPNLFSIRKNVKFADDTAYFNRNEYKLER